MEKIIQIVCQEDAETSTLMCLTEDGKIYERAYETQIVTETKNKGERQEKIKKNNVHRYYWKEGI